MAIIKELKKTIRFFIPYGIYMIFVRNKGVFKKTTHKISKFYSNKTENFGINLIDKNEECVVLANGPSLKKTFASKKIYEFIKKRKKFCVNAFVFSDEFFKLKPEYICFADLVFWSHKLRAKIQKFVDGIYNKLLAIDWQVIIFMPKYAENWNFIIDLPKRNQNIKIIYINTATSLHKKENLARFIEYKENQATPLIHNVALLAIYLSINIGFKNVYLFGLDHSWHENITVRNDNVVCIVDKHFYDKKSPGLIPIHASYDVSGNTLATMEEIFR